jgi:sodium-dependent phosphate cotransporter
MSSDGSIPATALKSRATQTRILRWLQLGLALFTFFLGLELLGSSFRLLGSDVASALIETTANPFVGLFIGILATSIIQSSSTVTALVVSIVAGGGLTVAGAIPIVMGANVGTSITNTLVSLGHITRRDEFRLATAGATVHDMFNVLTVVILLPLEIAFGILSGPALWLAGGLSDVGAPSLLSPVNAVIRPVADAVIALLGSNGWWVLPVGVGVLFGAIRYMTSVLRRLAAGASERAMHAYLLAAPSRALLLGIMVTVIVQSSSITTSVVVPLVAAGIVSVRQIFPFVVGANIGTTITAMLAALALASGGNTAGLAALEVAFAHLCFNLFGTGLFFPIKVMREIPVRLATSLGSLAARNRAYALAYIGILFFAIPVAVITLTRVYSDGSATESREELQSAPSDSVRVEDMRRR